MTSKLYNVDYIKTMSPELKLATIKTLVKLGQAYRWSQGQLADLNSLIGYIVEPNTSSWYWPVPDESKAKIPQFFKKLKTATNLITAQELQKQYCKMYIHFRPIIIINETDLMLIKKLLL